MRTRFLFTLATLGCLTTTRAQWVAVGSGMDMYVHASAVYNDELYASGNFEHADGNLCLGIARWNGSAWSDVSGGFQTGALSHVVSALIEFNGELIAGGWVDSVAGMPIQKVARWNGSTWSPMGTDCLINTPRGFAIHNGELYMCGQGSGALFPRCVQKWNGTNWVSIENNAGSVEVYSLASYNGELYASGAFANFDGATVNGIARWNGTSWSDVGGGIPGITFTDIVRPLVVYNGKLYAGGHFLAMGSATVNDIAAWDGTSWSDVGGGVGGATAGVQSLVASGGKLFVGGSFWTVNGATANRAAYWDGAWTVLGTDLGAGARTQAVYHDELYSFGEGAFNGHNYAARWSDDTFSSIAETSTPAMILLAPNPVAQGGTVTLASTGANAMNEVSAIAFIGADGRSVIHEQVNGQGRDRLELPLIGVAAGSYIVEMSDRLGSVLGRGRVIVE